MLAGTSVERTELEQIWSLWIVAGSGAPWRTHERGHQRRPANDGKRDSAQRLGTKALAQRGQVDREHEDERRCEDARDRGRFRGPRQAGGTRTADREDEGELSDARADSRSRRTSGPGKRCRTEHAHEPIAVDDR